MAYSKSKKPKRVRYHFSIVFFAAVVIFGVMFYRYFTTTQLEDVLSQANDGEIISSDLPSSNEETDVLENISDEQPSETPVNPVPLSEKAQEDYLNSCVFVGDSVAYGLSSYNILPASNVLAGVSTTLAKIDTAKIDTQYGEMTVIDALTQLQPETLYIMFGSSNAAYMNANELYQSFSAFMKNVTAVCENARIYVISVPPVTQEKEAALNVPVSNDVIDEFNAKLLDYCDRNSFSYLDLNSSLKNENGDLPAEDAENDGMHLKYSTYSKFVDYILTHIAA